MQEGRGRALGRRLRPSIMSPVPFRSWVCGLCKPQTLLGGVRGSARVGYRFCQGQAVPEAVRPRGEWRVWGMSNGQTDEWMARERRTQARLYLLSKQGHVGQGRTEEAKMGDPSSPPIPSGECWGLAGRLWTEENGAQGWDGGMSFWAWGWWSLRPSPA